VIYDEIEYTKKGWINRNRFLSNGNADYFTLPLKKDSDFLFIKDRYLSDQWVQDKIKIKNKIIGAYSKAPFYKESFELFLNCLEYTDQNLFNFIHHSLIKICDYLNINTPILVSSSLNIDNELKSKDKVISICKRLNATTYINPIGGIELYAKEDFISQGIALEFFKTNNVNYSQFKNDFVPFLSILDVLMFNPREIVIEFVNKDFIIL
jgi:hypothetical protein